MRELKKCIDVSLASLNFAQRVSIVALFKRQGSHFASARKRRSRALARAFFKELEIETRAKPPPRFRERSPYTPVHMCSALIHATSPRERFAAESKSSPRRPAHRDDRALRRTRPPRRASVLPPGRARTADKRSGQAPWRPWCACSRAGRCNKLGQKYNFLVSMYVCGREI